MSIWSFLYVVTWIVWIALSLGLMVAIALIVYSRSGEKS